MKKILIIEDEPEMRRNLATILRLERFEPVTAANGEQGLKLARDQAPDLVLCDVMMPGISGFDVLKALHQDPAARQIPFIFLTAKGERNDVRDGMNLGADDYLTKPVDKADLLRAIRARLNRLEHLGRGEFKPNFDSPDPLLALGLTPKDVGEFL